MSESGKVAIFIQIALAAFVFPISLPQLALIPCLFVFYFSVDEICKAIRGSRHD